MELDYMEKKNIEEKITSLLSRYAYNLSSDDHIDSVDSIKKTVTVFPYRKVYFPDSKNGFPAICLDSKAKDNVDKITGAGGLLSPFSTYTGVERGKEIMELNYMEKKNIEEKITDLLSQYGYNLISDDHIDIVNFVKKNGFSVGNALLPDSEDGFLAIRPDSKAKDNVEKIIGVNVNRSLELKRFIVAHEFAHSVLHYRDEQIFLHRENKKGKDGEENDADYFAAALLMPQKSFKRTYQQYKNEGLSDNLIYLKLAAIYKTPLESVLRRISEVDSIAQII